MSTLILFFAALILSMAIIPLMIRMAPRLGMVDLPDQRKVHTSPTPRAGGVGIVCGALLPLVLWMTQDTVTIAYIAGAAVLLIFGIWDDAKQLNHRVKFVGQIAASAIVVYYGDVHIHSLPLMDMEVLPVSISKPFTVFAIVGMINALNVSDGLDGLAGGLSILSLAGMAYLASSADGTTAVAIAVATLGGVFGFLRFNTHPARVFMGDSGSQFLGYTLAVLAVYLTATVNPALSPALPLLFLGLPVVDMLAVIVQRMHYGISPFVATKHHVHHRLLELGFAHYEAVVVIYTIQTAAVLASLMLGYESDTMIVAVYVGLFAVPLGLIAIAFRYEWRAHRTSTAAVWARLFNATKARRLLDVIPHAVVAVAIPLLFVLTGPVIESVPRDVGVAAGVLAVMLTVFLIYLRLSGQPDTLVLRGIVYITAAFLAYVGARFLPEEPASLRGLEIGYFVVLAIATALAVRYARTVEFRTTPMDYLVVFIVVSVGILSQNQNTDPWMANMVTRLVVLFYACEVLLQRARSPWSPLTFATVVALVTLAIRGLA